MKYVFLILRDRVGDLEFRSETVDELEDDVDIDQWADEQAKMNWAEDEEDEETGEWIEKPGEKWEGSDCYFSPSGEIATKVSSVRIIPEAHYRVLKQYI